MAKKSIRNKLPKTLHLRLFKISMTFWHCLDVADGTPSHYIIFFSGTLGLLLNGLCYLLIGGYTFHQGSFLYVTESGDVVLSKVVVNQTVQHGERRLSHTKYVNAITKPQKQRQSFWELTRDVTGRHKNFL